MNIQEQEIQQGSLEKLISDLEEGYRGFAFASGMATTAVLSLLSQEIK